MKKILSIIVASLMLFTIAFSFASVAKAGGEKVNICHRTESESNPWNANNINTSALETHLGHGDFLYNGPVKDNGKPDNKDKQADQWCEGNVPHPELKDLTVSADCSNLTGLSKWKVTNPNDFSVHFSWEVVTLADPGTIKEKSSADIVANGDYILETSTPGEIRVTIYWPENGENHACATNEDVKVCSTSTPIPTPIPQGGSTGIPKIKISPQVLGTTAPTASAQPLPVTGADVNYSWIYYFLIIASLSFTYYMKAAGWKKISR